MNWLTHLFSKISGFFTSAKALKVEEELATLVVQAAPIVKAIAALTPNRTVQEIEAAYTAYGVPTAAQISADPTSTGNALLNLATAIIQKVAPASAVSVIQTAVQLALLAVKTSASTSA